MNIETLKTDILILGSGGAGLFAALHAKQANPDLDITIAVKGLQKTIVWKSISSLFPFF